MYFRLLILFFSILFYSCERYEDCNVEVFYDECWDVGFSLASANCAVYEDTLYLFFGRDEFGDATLPSSKIRYAGIDDLSNFKEKELPMKPRVSASSVVVDDKLYFGLGFCGRVYAETSILHDWWVYDFKTKELERLADFPTECTISPVMWFDDGFIYSALGYDFDFDKAIYRYDVVNDCWELYSKSSDLFVRVNAFGAKVGERVFLGGGRGKEMKKDWWSYDWISNMWYQCADFPAEGRIFASALPIDNKIYVFGGRYFGGSETREYFYETILCYDVDRDKWDTVGKMEFPSENLITFEYNGDLYWGLGQRQHGTFVKKIYRRDMR